MRFLIVSDLHSNIHAFRAVLEDAGSRGYDRVLCLGDIVGYGPHPNEVVDALKALSPHAVVRGNHDKVVTGIEEGNDFSEIALEAAMWTRGELTRENLGYLSELPQGPIDAGGFLISHGTPILEDAYLLSDLDAAFVFGALPFSLAFFGHSHFACTFFVGEDGEVELEMLDGDAHTLAVREGYRYLVNPGSLGQPRDHDPRAAYAIYDRDAATVTVHRVAYDIAAAQARMADLGLPEALAQRLSFGI